jgi:RHS repeat-associated protein
MTAQNQGAVWDVIYAPFGAVSYIWTNPETMDLRFPGQWFQLETGLAYNWHRHYDPSLGRYIQPDPIGLAGGGSLYGYVDGNPLAYADPNGLQQTKFPGLPLPIPLGPWNNTQALSQGLSDAFGLNSRFTYQTYTRYKAGEPLVMIVLGPM